MNIFFPEPPTRAGSTDGRKHWKKFRSGVVAGFTWKELIVAMLLAIMVLEFIHY